jgi:CO dehydrogenase maturation factor
VNNSIIAITGKGGVGKTTVAGIVVRQLIARNRTPVLAVDADPNTCLDGALGVRVESTIGRIREESREIAARGLSAGISKQELLELKIAESLVEADNFDLIAMGRCEGPGCYCYANNVLKAALTEIAYQYPFVVLDNEAGLENLSRRIVQKVDLFIVVSDPSQRGLETAARLHALAAEMQLEYTQSALVLNRMRSPEIPDRAYALKEQLGAGILAGIERDDTLADMAESGSSVFTLPDSNRVVSRIDSILERYFSEVQ